MNTVIYPYFTADQLEKAPRKVKETRRRRHVLLSSEAQALYEHLRDLGNGVRGCLKSFRGAFYVRPISIIEADIPINEELEQPVPIELVQELRRAHRLDYPAFSDSSSNLFGIHTLKELSQRAIWVLRRMTPRGGKFMVCFADEGDGKYYLEPHPQSMKSVEKPKIREDVTDVIRELIKAECIFLTFHSQPGAAPVPGSTQGVTFFTITPIGMEFCKQG